MIRRSCMLAICVAVLAVATGCGERDTGGTLAPQTFDASSGLANSSELLPGQRRPIETTEGSATARLVKCERRPAAVGSAEIGPRGGELIVGRARLIVPPGALRSETLISAAAPSGDVAFVSFQPEGLVFRKPAGLVFDAAGCDASIYQTPDVVYLGEDGEILERIPAVFSNYWHTVAAPIQHFSGYALAW